MLILWCPFCYAACLCTYNLWIGEHWLPSNALGLIHKEGPLQSVEANYVISASIVDGIYGLHWWLLLQEKDTMVGMLTLGLADIPNQKNLNVVHYVQVPLTGSTVAVFWACGSWLGLVCEHFTYSAQYCGQLGPLYGCSVLGPHLGNVARGICLDLAVMI